MRRLETVRLTREELYELVWSKPMTAIAADFGMSSVAFGKHCITMNVPTPGRGYWQRLQHGHKEKRSSLPKASPDTPVAIGIDKYPPMPTRPERDAPDVVVPDRVSKLHPVAHELGTLLNAARFRDNMVVVSGPSGSIVRVASGTIPRAQRLLHALFVALEARAHSVTLTNTEYGGDKRYKLEAGSPPVAISLVERLGRVDHVVTKEERAMALKPEWLSKYDFNPSGELTFALYAPWHSRIRKTWRDGENQRVEELLGEFILGLEDAMAAWHDEHEKRQRERAAAEEQERRRKEEERQATHQRALAEDLGRMATAWSEAQAIRAFLAAVGAKVVESGRSEPFSQWLAWATQHADRLDPLSEPTKIAKILHPRSPEDA